MCQPIGTKRMTHSCQLALKEMNVRCQERDQNTIEFGNRDPVTHTVKV
jgi:hypothetical protein